MNPLQKIENNKNNFTNVEQQIYDRVTKEPTTIIHLSIDDIATETKTSKAAIIRFCKKLGYSGFAEFKFELSRYIISGVYDETVDDNLDMMKSITSLYSSFLRQFNDHVQKEDIEQFVAEIKKAQRVKIVGYNRTGLSAMQMRYRISKIGFDAEAITDMALVQSVQDYLTKGDLVILFTIYAKSKTYNNLVKTISESDAKLVLITMTPHSSYEKYSDLHFVLPCISKASTTTFLDDQALFFVFIEIVLAKLAT